VTRAIGRTCGRCVPTYYVTASATVASDINAHHWSMGTWAPPWPACSEAVFQHFVEFAGFRGIEWSQAQSYRSKMQRSVLASWSKRAGQEPLAMGDAQFPSAPRRFAWEVVLAAQC
jgi:hypothetical protein